MALGPREVLPDAGPSRPPPQEAPPQPMPFTPVCWAIIGLSVVMYGLGQLLPETHDFGVLYGPLVKAGEWWRIATFLVTHGGIIHLLFNMSAVWTLGRVLEANIGSARFLLLSAIGGIGSACFVLWLNPLIPTVGASGMILSWLGAMLPLATKSGRSQLLMWLGQTALISLLPGVSWAGHLGGVLFGLPCGFALSRGPAVFRYAGPVLLFVTAVLTFFAGN